MSNPRIANEMVGLIVNSLKTALADNEQDGFGAAKTTEVYDGTCNKTGKPLTIKLSVSAIVKTNP